MVSPLVKLYELVYWDKCNPPFEMPYGGISFQTKPVTLEQQDSEDEGRQRRQEEVSRRHP